MSFRKTVFYISNCSCFLMIKVSCIAVSCQVLLCLSISGLGVIFITSYVWLIKLPLPFLVKPASVVLDVSYRTISRGWALTYICMSRTETPFLFA